MKNLTNIVLSLDEQLEAARKRIEVQDAELDEAKTRRSKIGTALKRVFPGSRIYVNGSVAHGDALTPLTDIDLGVVVKGAEADYGPGRKGPTDLKERAAAAIRQDLKPDYPSLVVIVEGQKRSILVRFGDPVTPGQTDFTADVIVAVDNIGAEGLFIPRYTGWDRSHPEKHTELVHEAISNTAVVYARVVRLVKHWNRRHDKPICSWNVKALALDCITEPTTLLAGLTVWFTYAEEQLTIGETEDPAKVAPHPIKMRKTKTVVLRALANARTRLARAVELEEAGYPVLAHSELAKLFNDEDMLPAPGRISVEAEQARLARDEAARRGQHDRPATPGRRPSVLVPPVPVRSWAP
jgi:predicted nucleotidyltransferase